MNYLDIGEVILIHEEMLRIGGGREGIADYRLLHSAVERPKATFAGQPLYSTIWYQAAAFMHSLIKNYPLNDGNKRTGFFSTMRFLRINGYNLAGPKKEIIRFTLAVDTEDLSLEEIAAWLKRHSQEAKRV